MSERTIGVNDVPIDENLAQDPDYIAFNQAEKEGLFDELEPGTWVFFRRGRFVGTSANRDSILKDYPDKEHPGGFVAQVGVPTPEADIPTIF